MINNIDCIMYQCIIVSITVKILFLQSSDSCFRTQMEYREKKCKYTKNSPVIIFVIFIK